MSHTTVNAKPDTALIDLSHLFAEGSRSRQLFRHTAQVPTEALLGVSGLNTVYENIRIRASFSPERNFFDHSLDELGLTYRISSGSIESIPTNGPVFVVSNHPFGGIDGLILGSLILSRRKDSRILANSLLARMPEIVPHIVPVNPFGTRQAKKDNPTGLRAAGKWLSEGHCLATFPAGSVSHFQNERGECGDGPWHANVARLARAHGATVVPLYFEGRNSAFFQIASRLHPRVRTALLIRELLNKSGMEIRLRIGSPILPSRFAEHPENTSLSRFFQMRSEILGHQIADAQVPHTATFSPVAERKPVEDLLADIDGLRDDSLLYQKGAYQIFSTTADRIPNILHEIGRTRELTFRPVGEGTGKPLDLDRFDHIYHHLILWNDETCELVGAYRIGLVDRILAEHGFDGLYSNTIFKYSPDAFDSLGKGKTLELGRSYIVPSYQKRGTSLFLLWRGIVKFIRKNPGYTKLFGAVSISDQYHPLSKALIIRYLKQHKLQNGFEQKIRARKNPDCENLRSLRAFDYPGALPSLDDVSSLVSELESDKKGVPTLLKHYLQLRGVILGIGVDQSFSDALDGFILVDTEKMDPAVLKKYEGDAGS